MQSPWTRVLYGRWVILILIFSVCALFSPLTKVIGRYLPDSAFFQDPLDAAAARSLRRTLSALVAALDAANLTYYMASGTLLGSYRHHGRISWDDDVDLAVRVSDKPALKAALTKRPTEYGLFHSGAFDSSFHWKFYPRRPDDGYQVPFRPYRWPFVDLLFFDENATHVWSASPNLRHEIWTRRQIFPLVRRPYDGLWLPAPCDARSALQVKFGTSSMTSCMSRDFSHVYVAPMLFVPRTVPCSSLSATHAFVKRSSSRSNLTETLVIGDRTISSLVVDACPNDKET